MGGSSGSARSMSSSTASGACSAMACRASARPRSARTGGWMPRTRPRRSRRAVADVSRASATSSRTACRGRRRFQEPFHRTQGDADRDHADLGAVVQVAFDPAQFGLLRAEGLGPGLGQFLDPLGQVGAGGRRQHRLADHEGSVRVRVGREHQRCRDEYATGQAEPGQVAERRGRVEQVPRPEHRAEPRVHQPGESTDHQRVQTDNRRQHPGQHADQRVEQHPQQVQPRRRVGDQPTSLFRPLSFLVGGSSGR